MEDARHSADAFRELLSPLLPAHLCLCRLSCWTCLGSGRFGVGYFCKSGRNPSARLNIAAQDHSPPGYFASLTTISAIITANTRTTSRWTMYPTFPVTISRRIKPLSAKSSSSICAVYSKRCRRADRKSSPSNFSAVYVTRTSPPSSAWMNALSPSHLCRGIEDLSRLYEQEARRNASHEPE